MNPVDRRLLRRNQTHGEALLWNHLRGAKMLGIRFRRQQQIDRFIVDFYCPRIRLAIEIDGPTHDERVEADAARTEYLMAQGIRVIRFHDDEVRRNIADVVSAIRAQIDAHFQP